MKNTRVSSFAGSVVIDVHGIGYEVAVPLGDYEAVTLDVETKFYTHHHVREQAEELERRNRQDDNALSDEASMWSDLLSTSLGRVNWYEIVENNQE